MYRYFDILLRTLTTFSIFSSLLFFTAGCKNSNINVVEGNHRIGIAPKGTLYMTNAITIVHVDMFERVSTLKNANELSNYIFLETYNSEGMKTSLLRTRFNPNNGLRTADILEGKPNINDRANAVEADKSARLRENYGDVVYE